MSEKARGKQRMQFVHEQLSARPARAATPEDNAAQTAQAAQVACDLEEAQRLCDRYAEQTARITKMCDDLDGLDGLDGLDTLDDAVGPAFRHGSAMSMPMLCCVSDVDDDASEDAREPIVSGDIIVLEEAAYCDPGLISEVIVPLLSMQQSCLLCISTLLESGNHYSRMFELKDGHTGEPLFETIQISLVCDDCMKTDHPELCTHKLAEMPRWLSSSKMEVVKSLLADDPAMLLRESMGVGADSTNKAYHAADINALLQRPGQRIHRDELEYNDRSNTNHVVVAVDPAGGGASAFAVASVVQQPNGSIVMTGMDTLRTRDVRETHRLVIEHIRKIREIRNLEDCTIVLCLESNLAFECQHIVHSIQAAGVKKWLVLQEGAGNTIGWLTTNERKESMTLLMREALSVGKIHFSDQFFSTTQGIREVKEQFENELRNFCVLVEAAKTPFGKVKKTYSGKVGGRNDDLIIAAQLALAGSRVFYTDNRYRTFRPVNNDRVPIAT